jgi:hypothetical protein
MSNLELDTIQRRDPSFRPARRISKAAQEIATTSCVTDV